MHIHYKKESVRHVDVVTTQFWRSGGEVADASRPLFQFQAHHDISNCGIAHMHKLMRNPYAGEEQGQVSADDMYTAVWEEIQHIHETAFNVQTYCDRFVIQMTWNQEGNENYYTKTFAEWVKENHPDRIRFFPFEAYNDNSGYHISGCWITINSDDPEEVYDFQDIEV